MGDVRTRMRNRNSLLRRLPVVAALSLVALSACGSEEPGTSDEPITSVAAGATDAPAQSDDLRAPEPIEVVAGSPGAASAAEAASEGRVMADATATEPAAMPSTDMMIAPTYVADFVVGELPGLPENTTGYVYDAAASVTAERAAEIAAYFGVEGEPVRVDEWEPGGWQIGPTDGSEPSVFVSDDAQQTWSYSPAWQDQPVMVACETPASPDGSPPPSTIECPIPEPPAGVPSAEEAEAKARELLADLGVDASAMKFDTYADEWSASVNITELVTTDAASQSDGVPTGRYWGFSFGAEGSLQWANGLLAEPQPVGPYTLIDLDTALARLREQVSGNGAPMPVDMVEPVSPDAATSELVDPAVTAEPKPGSGVGDVEVVPNSGVSAPPDSSMGGEPPFETYPAPEPITVTLVDVQADLWWAWAADGSVWMVPAYRFIGDDGGWYTVPAVTDDLLVEVAPPTVTAVPLPEPAPATVPAVDTIPTDPSDTSALQPLVGLSIEEFGANAEAMGWQVRIVEIDGESQAVTMDFLSNRVNVAVVTNDDGSQTVKAIVNAG
jgi:hypothetical protein